MKENRNTGTRRSRQGREVEMAPRRFAGGSDGGRDIYFGVSVRVSAHPAHRVGMCRRGVLVEGGVCVCSEGGRSSISLTSLGESNSSQRG